MQVLLSEMQSVRDAKFFASRAAKPACRPDVCTCRPDVFAPRAAKPACRPAIFTGRPDHPLFYYFTTSFASGSRQEVFASRAAKPACRLPFFACLAANPTRPPHPSISQRFFCSSDRQSCMSSHVFACRPNVSLVGELPVCVAGIQGKQTFNGCWVRVVWANWRCLKHAFLVSSAPTNTAQTS